MLFLIILDSLEFIIYCNVTPTHVVFLPLFKVECHFGKLMWPIKHKYEGVLLSLLLILLLSLMQSENRADQVLCNSDMLISSRYPSHRALDPNVNIPTAKLEACSIYSLRETWEEKCICSFFYTLGDTRWKKAWGSTKSIHHFIQIRWKCVITYNPEPDH